MPLYSFLTINYLLKVCAFMNIEEISLVLFLLDKSLMDKYYKYLSKLSLETETKNFLKTVQDYFKEFPDKETLTVEELLIYFAVKHPLLKKRTSYQGYLEKLGSVSIDSKVLEENLNHFLEKYFASDIVFKLTGVLDGDDFDVLDEVQDALLTYNDVKIKMSKDESSTFVSSSLDELLSQEVTVPGLKWRLACLNNDIGELRGGSLGHVFARVDTGKTSFIASEVSNFASQLEDGQVILWCNNEEKGTRVKLRVYQAVLNCSKSQLLAYPKDAESEYERLGGNRIKIYDEALIYIEDIEQLLKEYDVRLLVVDQGDKIHFAGEKDLSTVDRLKRLYNKFRELAKQYDCDIITVGQAASTAEGLKFLDTTHMDNSKVGKPGELDYAIGIGKTHDVADTGVSDIRYISVCKNKMNDGVHGKHEVLFNSQCAIYSDKTTTFLTPFKQVQDNNTPSAPEVSSSVTELVKSVLDSQQLKGQ